MDNKKTFKTKKTTKFMVRMKALLEKLCNAFFSGSETHYSYSNLLI